MQAGYKCCMATAFLQKDECLKELNILIKSLSAWSVGPVAAIAFFCKQPPKLLGGSVAFDFELTYKLKYKQEFLTVYKIVCP